MRTFLFMLALGSLFVGCESTSTPSFCSPPGFMTCSGNELVTCVGMPGQDGGTSTRVDCTAMGQFCRGSGFDVSSCGAPLLGDTCFGRNLTGCAAGDQLLRCVWISEQPEPGYSGDVGIWRVQTDCTTSSQVCRLATASCAAP